MTIGQRIKAIRDKKGLTQLKLSEGTGIDVTLISKYENGIKEIGLDNLTRIAEFLETSLDYLVYGEGPAYKQYFLLKPLPDIFDGLNDEIIYVNVRNNHKRMPKIFLSILDEMAAARQWGSLSYNHLDEITEILENHSKLFYKAIELGLYAEAFDSKYDELEAILIERGVDIIKLIKG